MKDVAKTSIVVLVVLFSLIVVFFISGNVEYGVSLLQKNNLSQNDPTVSILFNRIKENNDLRKASLVNEDLTSMDIVRFVLDNMTDKDYKKKTYKKEKITCSITNGISFTTDKKACNVLILKNDTIMEYQKKFFNTERELKYEDIKYHGLYCKNNGKNYYCLTGKYNDEILGYSAFREAYQIKDKVVIREYYLRVNVKNTAKCLQYFDEKYCKNYLKEDKPYLSEDIIKKDGVVFEHVFREKDDSYYLEKSFIVSEG